MSYSDHAGAATQDLHQGFYSSHPTDALHTDSHSTYGLRRHSERQPSVAVSAVSSPQTQAADIKYELPKTVQSIRDGWQWTSSSGAVVSGLLAASAAQLLRFFRGDDGLSDREPRFKNLVLIFCYAALFLNISATIGSFILTDNLGELGYRASKKGDTIGMMGRTTMNAEAILQHYGASSQWKVMLVHWLITFYLGILSLIVSVLAFVWLEEPQAIAITMTFVVGLTILPVSYFILLRPIVELIRKK